MWNLIWWSNIVAVAALYVSLISSELWIHVEIITEGWDQFVIQFLPLLIENMKFFLGFFVEISLAVLSDFPNCRAR